MGPQLSARLGPEHHLLTTIRRCLELHKWFKPTHRVTGRRVPAMGPVIEVEQEAGPRTCEKGLSVDSEELVAAGPDEPGLPFCR